jgi:archaellum component FlaC
MVDNDAPLPRPQAGGTVPTDNAVDFAQDFDKAAAAQDQLANAIPQQARTFEQVQRDLKASNGQVPTKVIIPDEINATLDSISEEMTLNVNQIKHLETTITNLAGSVEQLNKSISAMDNRVLGLTETVDGLAQDLSNVKKVMADEDLDLTAPKNVRFSGKKMQPISSASTEYSVHAIIPGRAWLKNSAGQIITVTEGDKLGDFGTVAAIDATNGIVRTSSGLTFR